MAETLPVAHDARSGRVGEPLRLLWLIDSFTMGGAESLAVAFAREAVARGVELTVCARTSIDGNPLRDEIAATGARVVNLEARTLRDHTAFHRLLGLVRGERFHVIHAHLAYSAIWGALASRFTGIPVVATLHVAPPALAGIRERIRQWLLVRLLNRWAARVVMVSEAQRRAWGSAFARDKVSVIHNGVPTHAMTRTTPTPDGPLRVLTVAVLREGKGIDVLLDALRVAIARGEHIACTIAGDGPLREELMKRANGLPVRWPGFRRDIDVLMRDADLFILPTLADAFPTVLLEAMAAGLPVIASDVGGVPEIVDAPETGWLVRPGDSGALADALVRAAQDEEWRRDASTAARQRFAQQFTIEHLFDRLEQLYTEVRR